MTYVFLSEVSDFCHSIICIDHVSKWTQTNPTKNKDALTVAQVLYRLIFRHGCFEIQINDQETEFVNLASEEPLALTAVEQRITSSYHSQSNKLVKRRIHLIKKHQSKSWMEIHVIDQKLLWTFSLSIALVNILQ